jgi:hypothetical protein
VGIRHADDMAPSSRKKLALTSPTSGGRSVGIVRLRIEAMEFFCLDRKEGNARHKKIVNVRRCDVFDVV